MLLVNNQVEPNPLKGVNQKEKTCETEMKSFQKKKNYKFKFLLIYLLEESGRPTTR